MSLETTKSAANKLFTSEGVHSLSVTEKFDNKHSLMSTSGTSFYSGTFEGCLARKAEIMLFATTGY